MERGIATSRLYMKPDDMGMGLKSCVGVWGFNKNPLTKTRGTFRASIEPSRSTRPRRPNRCSTCSIDCFPKVCPTRRTRARHHRHDAGACQPPPQRLATSLLPPRRPRRHSRRCSMPLAPRFTAVACASTAIHFPTRRLDACLTQRDSLASASTGCFPSKATRLVLATSPSPSGTNETLL